MSKVLGYTNNGGEDWFVSSSYGNKEIQGIPDPDGGHAINAPVAIPSPFARIDLVRNAFEHIVHSPDLVFLQQGPKVIVSKEDERLVSQCLDLAEILFFYDNYRANIEIIEWNKSAQINELLKSENQGHRRLGAALSLYLTQDESSFNFDKMRSIYLVKYNHKIIGGTSPLTFFFPAARDNAALNLRSHKGKTYFRDIVPLYLRDKDFQRYMYLLFANHDELVESMPSFHEYLIRSLAKLDSLDNKLYSELNKLNHAELHSRFVDLHSSNAGQVVEVLGAALKTIDPNVLMSSIRESDFVIHSAKDTSAQKPLVLQNNFNKDLKYVDSTWDHRTTVPYWDEKPLTSRKLPGHDIIYPYLTVSDFLEEDIIRLVYPLNAEKYFDGNLKLRNPDETKSYLLPLKANFFRYFNAGDLVNGGLGKPHISIEEGAVASAIRVQLAIPIAGGKENIVFERIYHNEGTPDQKNNKGIIKELQFGVTIFPFIRHGVGIDPYYNVQLVDRDVVGKFADGDYSLNFYSNDSNAAVAYQLERYRNKKQKGDLSKVGTKYFSLGHAFDYIQVDNKLARGIIIPKLITSSNSGQHYTFAIDFGTTNTHIEYSVNNQPPNPFEIQTGDVQAVPFLNDKTDHNFSGTGALDIRELIAREFVPEIIGKGSPYKFPHRSVISQSKNNAPANGGKVLVDYNLAFIFEKDIDNNNTFFTNLKWDSREQNNDFRVKAFLEELMLLIRNKVIINNGNLAETKIIWTYPVSMSASRKNNLQHIWNELFKKYINPDAEPVDMCESIAPYYYFQDDNTAVQGKGYGVSALMDIGGGTSDVVVYEDNEPKLISSYKFAANTIFGDGYNEFGNIVKNEFINKFKGFFDQNLTEKNHGTLKSISDVIYNSRKSADYNTFLFSLVNNMEIKEKDLFDYDKKIANDHDLKIIFLYFYCAKVYHIARLMQVNKIGLPMNVIFSGNGSKILSIISPSPKTISDITKAIFLKVYNVNEYPPAGLKINVEGHFPKEATCKGALINYIKGAPDIDVVNLKKILTCVEEEGKFSLLNSEINDDLKNKVVAQVEKFNTLFIDLNKAFPFKEHFDVSAASLEKFKAIVTQHIKAYLQAGIDFNQRLDGAQPQADTSIAETLFFYPMIGTIQDLIKELAPIKTK